MQRPGLNFKNADGDSTTGYHPEVHEEVLKEVKAMSGKYKDIVDKMNQEMCELRKVVDQSSEKMDGLVESKVTKMQEAVVTRQEFVEKLDTEMKGRIDALDLALQRVSISGSGTSEAEKQLFDDAKEFKQMIMNRKGEKGVAQDGDVDVKSYKQYCAAFDRMLRYSINQNGLKPDDEKFLSVVSEVDGGILVPPTMGNRITKRVWELDPIRQLADTVQIGTDAYEELVDVDEPQDGWEGELKANPETPTPEWKKVYIPTHIQSAMPKASTKILEDGSINVENWLSDKIARRMARTEGSAFVNGDGMGKPRGFLAYSVYANSATLNYYSFGAIEYVPALDSVLSGSAIITCFFHLLEEYQQRATWIMNRFTVMKTMLLVDGDQRPLWTPGQTALSVAGAPSTLLGAPVRMSSTMPVVAEGAYPMALADWKEAYVIVDRKGISILRDPYTAKPFVLFYTRRRVGGGMRNFQSIVLMKTSAT